MSYLLKPVQAGTLTLTNRLVMPPMATAKADPDGKVNQSVLDYYAEKSEGGYLSLIIIEHSFIQLDGKASDLQLSVSDDSMVEPTHVHSGNPTTLFHDKKAQADNLFGQNVPSLRFIS